MKWFTMAWWSGDAEHDAAQQYQEHLDAMGDRLHAGLLALSARGILHDANVTSLSVQGSSAILRLQAGGPTRPALSLHYAGVTRLDSAYAGQALSGPGGYGDLGYDEVDIDADGLFVHRMLFSSGIQLDVHFTAFSVDESPARESTEHG